MLRIRCGMWDAELAYRGMLKVGLGGSGHRHDASPIRLAEALVGFLQEEAADLVLLELTRREISLQGQSLSEYEWLREVFLLVKGSPDLDEELRSRMETLKLRHGL